MKNRLRKGKVKAIMPGPILNNIQMITINILLDFSYDLECGFICAINNMKHLLPDDRVFFKVKLNTYEIERIFRVC